MQTQTSCWPCLCLRFLFSRMETTGPAQKVSVGIKVLGYGKCLEGSEPRRCVCPRHQHWYPLSPENHYLPSATSCSVTQGR